MRDVFKVTRWELSTGVKNKTFLAMTFLIPVIIIIIGFVAGYFATRDGQQELTIGVIDKTRNIYNPLKQSIQNTNIELREYSQSVASNIKDTIEREELDGLLIIPADIYETNNLTYYYKDLQGRDISVLQNAIDPLIVDKRLKDQGYSPVEIR